MHNFRDKDHAESLLQMAKDHIKTCHINGKMPGQHLFNMVADAEAYLAGEVSIEGIAGAQVFGHPQDTNLFVGIYGNFIPIKVSSIQVIERKLEQVQVVYDSLNKSIAETQYKAKQGDRKAKITVKSANFEESILARDLLRTETIPELNRLYKIFKGRK